MPERVVRLTGYVLAVNAGGLALALLVTPGGAAAARQLALFCGIR